MISKLEINGVHVEVGDSLKKYINRKIGGLDKLIPRQVRPSAHAKVFLSSADKKSACEVILELPGKTLQAKEATVNLFSSVDVVEAKLARQLRKYKTTHSIKTKRRLIRSFIRRVHKGQ